MTQKTQFNKHTKYNWAYSNTRTLLEKY